MLNLSGLANVPNCDGKSVSVGGQHFVRIAPVRPEEEHPVEEGLNVGHLVHSGGKHTQQAPVALGVPIFVQIVDCRYEAAVSIWIVHMLDVASSMARIAGDVGPGPFVDEVFAELVVAAERKTRTVCDHRAKSLDEIVYLRATLLAAVHPDDPIAANRRQAHLFPLLPIRRGQLAMLQAQMGAARGRRTGTGGGRGGPVCGARAVWVHRLESGHH